MQGSAQGHVFNFCFGMSAGRRQAWAEPWVWAFPTADMSHSALLTFKLYAIKTSSLEQTSQNPQINIIMEIIWS